MLEQETSNGDGDSIEMGISSFIRGGMVVATVVPSLLALGTAAALVFGTAAVLVFGLTEALTFRTAVALVVRAAAAFAVGTTVMLAVGTAAGGLRSVPLVMLQIEAHST